MALKLKGSTSGFVGLDAPSVAGNNTLILPENSGSAFQVFANDITAGVTTFTQVTVNRNGDLTVPGTISIGGTLTYEDVTSVDSIGIVTARGLSIFGNTTGLQVASGISTFQGISLSGNTSGLNVTGVGTFAGGSISLTSGGAERLNIASPGGGHLVIKNPSNAYLAFGTQDIERIRIQNDGKVGINTISATDILNIHVEGNTEINTQSFAFQKQTESLTGMQAAGLQITSNANTSAGKSPTAFLKLAARDPALNGNHGSNAIFAYSTRGVSQGSYGRGNLDLYMRQDLAYAFQTDPSATNPVVRMDPILRVTSSGTVGIGETVPLSKVHIKVADSGASAYAHGALFIEDSDHTYIDIASGTSGSGGINFGDSGGSQRGVVEYNHSSDYMRFITAGGERLRIASNGNVGVGGDTGTTYSLLDGIVVNASNGSAGLMINSSSSDHNAYLSFSYSTSQAAQFNAYIGRVGLSTLTFGTNNSIHAALHANGRFVIGSANQDQSTKTSNVRLENNVTSGMTKLGAYYIGYVAGTGNNGTGTLVIHKLGQNVGCQFSGSVTVHSYTGSAYLSGCIVARYNTDAITRDVTLQKAQSGMDFQLVSGTISGESGTYLGIKKNGGGTGNFYVNAFIAGNIESYGGLREISNSNWTTTTVHGTGIT